MENYLIGLAFFMIGLCIGSYLNVLAYRIPLGINTAKGRSMCTNCKKELKFYELIPVFSYIFLRGKCSECKSKISIIYPIIELITGSLYLLTFLVFGLTLETFLYIILISVLIVITLIDYKHKYIPDRFNIIILVLGIINTIYLSINEISYLYNNLIGFVIGIFIVLIIRALGRAIYKQEAMGLGDMKLLACLGLFFGFKGAIFIFFVGAIFASFIELLLIALKVKEKENEIAFGPYLVYATIFYLFIGETLLNLYLQILGG